MVIEIKLTQGKFALVDDVDLHIVSAFKWQAHRHHGDVWYAYRRERDASGRCVKISMHGAIMGEAPKGLVIDHKDRNGLNNSRSTNLRFATPSQNCANGKKRASATGYRGVFRSNASQFKAGIKSNGAQIYLGHFNDVEAAARAYDAAAIKLHGAFATLNFSEVRP
jgi:hypothetical protein